MITAVKRDQFDVTNTFILHRPTGAKYTPHPGTWLSGNTLMGRLGERLHTGEDYREVEVRAMIGLLANEKAYGKLFSPAVGPARSGT